MPRDIPTPQDASPLAERRSLTVLCAEFVDMARLADYLDTEELHAIVQAAHTTCAAIIHGFEGYIAHYLSNGLVPSQNDLFCSHKQPKSPQIWALRQKSYAIK